MNKKDHTQSWLDLCYKKDPELKSPVPAYVFRDGQRIFYAPQKNKKGKKQHVFRNRERKYILP